MTLTPFQFAIVRQYSPDWIANDVFIGDDNDLAVIVSRAARTEAARGDVDYALAMEMNAAPPGSFDATREEMRAFLAGLVDASLVAIEDEKAEALGLGSAAMSSAADIQTAKRSKLFIEWLRSFLPARAYYLSNLA